jgi:integrase/recombinase XerC/integrase/recombinase XerD
MKLATTRKPTAIVKPQTIEDITRAFIQSQDVRPSSRYRYQTIIKQYFRWIEAKGYSLRDLTRMEILQYKEELLASGMSPLTVGSYLTAVRKLYTWAEANRLGPNIAKGIKTPSRKQQFRKQHLTETQGRELLQYFREKSLRDYAIVTLLLSTGLRTIEVTRANIEDVTHKQGKRILRVHGKGRDEKDGIVVLTDRAYKPIEDYLRSRGRTLTGEPLFTSVSNNNQGERLTTRTISGIVKDGLRGIGIDSREYTAHSLRHTTAVNILKAGGALTDAQAVLRHSSPVTTQIYTATIAEEIRLQRAPEELLDRYFS